MPVKKCIKDKKKGHKYGDSGKCYIGSNSRTKATKQGQAIKASQSRRKKR